MLTFVTVEVGEILQKLVLVAHQNLNNWLGFVWVGNKHLRMESLCLV